MDCVVEIVMQVVLRTGICRFQEVFVMATDDVVFTGHIKDDDDIPPPSRATMEAEAASLLVALVSRAITACRVAKRRPPPTRFNAATAASASGPRLDYCVVIRRP
uniref:Uncharacterized protein n=1 Tax=Oryza sativa subsp. japonica TaxID=39947 RepID=Q5Z7J8_ORYSJ|nr:hypothetical protein [Oryza sativa Japonica Group]